MGVLLHATVTMNGEVAAHALAPQLTTMGFSMYDFPEMNGASRAWTDTSPFVAVARSRAEILEI